MNTFVQLEDCINLEAKVERHQLKRIRRKPGMSVFESEIGDILVQCHVGTQLQVHQRTGVRIDSDAIWHRPKDVAALQRAMTYRWAQALLLPQTSGRYLLYGLVNPKHFRTTDKRKARAAFHRALQTVGIDISRPEYSESPYGAPREIFHLPNEVHTAAKITLQYGLDNGVDAYKLWLDDLRVLICSNGLVVEKDPYTWSHQESNKPIEEWLEMMIPKILGDHARLNQQIETAMTVKPTTSPDVLVHQALPELTSESFERIYEMVEGQYQQEKPTVWGLSQALSYVGTHKLIVEAPWGRSLQKTAARLLTVLN